MLRCTGTMDQESLQLYELFSEKHQHHLIFFKFNKNEIYFKKTVKVYTTFQLYHHYQKEFKKDFARA